MKMEFKTTMKCAIMTLSLFLAACTADVYEPKPEPTPEPGPTPEKGIVDIVNSTIKSKNITVNVQDAYEGKYYYTVEIFMGNPAFGENAKLLAGQKTNSKVPFSAKVSIPSTETYIYIRETDPFKRKRVYAYPVLDGDMVCDLGVAVTTKSASASSLRNIKAPELSEEVDFTVPSTAIPINEGGKIKTGNAYVVEKGQTLTITDKNSLPGDGNFSLYVRGTVKFNSKEMTLQKNSKIYILNGGKFIAEWNNAVLLCIGGETKGAQIAVENGGFLGEVDEKKKFNLSMTDHSKLINYGEVKLTGEKANGKYSMHVSANASIYNKGKMNVQGGLSATDQTNPIVNMGEFFIGNTSTFASAEIYNACVFVTDKCSINGATINLASGSIFKTNNFIAGGLTMNMDALSIFDCTEDDKSPGVHFEGEKNKINGVGTGDDYALFKSHKIKSKSWHGVVYSGKVEIEYVEHTNNGNYQEWYILNSPATFAVGQASVKIPADKCNLNTGNNNPGEGSGDTDEGYEESGTLSYTYLFEDNWPATGDYDMNDLVIGIKVMNVKKGAKTVSAKIDYTLYATGATKQIGAAFQLDNIDAGAMVGAEAGQSKAVFSLFDDAHLQLSSTTRAPINTYNEITTLAIDTVEFQFKTPSDQAVNVEDFNLFIITGVSGADKRYEIHVSGFEGTDKAATSDLSTKNYVSTDTGLMWALRIPSADFATYPKETVAMGDAYEGYNNWIKGERVPDWYTNPVEDKVILYSMFE